MSHIKPTSELHDITLKIKDHILTSNKLNEKQKWELLNNYHLKYLVDFDISYETLTCYNYIISTLLDHLKPTTFSEKSHEDIFDKLFISGIHHEAFMTLMQKLDSSCESFQQQKILDLLEKFLSGDCVVSLILSQCISSGVWDPQYVTLCKTWDDLIKFLVSLPERVANKVKGHVHDAFHFSCYVPTLISSVSSVMVHLHKRITENQNCTLSFLGKLLGKMSVLRYNDLIAKHLWLELVKNSENDFVWRKLSQNLVTKMPFSSLESFITSLLLTVPWYGFIPWIMGDEGVKNTKLDYVMTTKLILIRHFKKELILQNIIGYFASSASRQASFWKIFSSLVKIWSDKSASKFQNFDQQKYIASALVICAGWMKEIKDTSQASALLDKVLQGVMIRMSSSEEDVRSLGMIVGDFVVSSLNPKAPKLEFEKISDEKLVSDMKNLLVIPSNPGTNCLSLEKTNVPIKTSLKEKECKKELVELKVEKKKQEPSEIDSDDDLEPYDIPANVSQANVKRPFYLADCLKGLIEQESDDWFEQCLRHAKSLIESNPDTVHEVAVEMAKVVLHLENKYAFQDFQRIRHEILVCLTVHCPVLVADYLTSQFYAENYSIRQRLDILEIVAVASQMLSDPKMNFAAANPVPKQSPNQPSSASTQKIWRSIVEERIAAKTRYISKLKKSAPPEMVENRFSLVAGYFFFPLLAKYDKKNNMLKLFDDDSYVLGRLIYTLGVVMYSASNIPISQKMGKVLLQFLAGVRIHTDKFVREASIFAAAAVCTSVPSYLLLADEMSPLVLECKEWLQSVVENDNETDCQIKASYALSAIVQVVKSEMPEVFQMLSSEMTE